MRRLTRADLRGKPLESYCKRANTTTEDNRVYCYGLHQNNISGFGEWLADCCRECKAYVDNVTPLKDRSE